MFFLWNQERGNARGRNRRELYHRRARISLVQPTETLENAGEQNYIGGHHFSSTDKHSDKWAGTLATVKVP